MEQTPYKIPRLLLIGAFTGFINGLIGIGGGTILVPAIVLLLGEKQHTAHGTSLAVILPTAIASSYIYHSNSNLDLLLAVKIATTGIFGGYLGAVLMEKIPALRLKQLFGAFMIIAGIGMVL